MSRPCKGNVDALIDLMNGRLGTRAADRLRDHMDRCPGCEASYRRLEKTRKLVQEVGQEEPTGISWKRLDTQMHWQIARLPHAEESRKTHRFKWVMSISLASTVGLLLGLLLPVGLGDGSRQVSDRATVAAAEAPVAPLLVPQVVEVEKVEDSERVAMVTALHGEVLLQRGTGSQSPLRADQPVLMGDMVTTRKGRVSLQWESETGLSLGEHSRLVLSRLTHLAQRFSLHQGEVFLEVKKRSKNQALTVETQGINVSVRGTRFAVQTRDNSVVVRCFEGVVFVEPQSRAWEGIEVPAGFRVTIGRDAARAPNLARVTVAERNRPNLLGWKSLPRMFGSSTLLEVSSRTKGLDLHLDGRLVGRTPLTVRGSLAPHMLTLYKNGVLVEQRSVDFTRNIGSLVLVGKITRKRQALPPVVVSLLTRTARENGRSLRPCYERQLKRHEDLRGEVAVRLTIGTRTGQVQDVVFVKKTLANPPALRCMEHSIRSWTFPSLEQLSDRDSVQLVFSYIFKPPASEPIYP